MGDILKLLMMGSDVLFSFLATSSSIPQTQSHFLRKEKKQISPPRDLSLASSSICPINFNLCKTPFAGGIGYQQNGVNPFHAIAGHTTNIIFMVGALWMVLLLLRERKNMILLGSPNDSIKWKYIEGYW